MGGKSQPQMPPPVDNQAEKAAAEADAKLEAEKKKLIGTKKKGMYGTIMTDGQGVEEEATTSTSLLGGKK
jgi:hypothetical protein